MRAEQPVAAVLGGRRRSSTDFSPPTNMSTHFGEMLKRTARLRAGDIDDPNGVTRTTLNAARRRNPHGMRFLKAFIALPGNCCRARTSAKLRQHSSERDVLANQTVARQDFPPIRRGVERGPRCISLDLLESLVSAASSRHSRTAQASHLRPLDCHLTISGRN